MSSHHRLNPSSGDIEHINHLSEDIGALYLSDDYSDVTLIVGGQRFNAHKIILAARSQYFRALLFGGLKESMQHEIELKDANLAAFKGLLEYIYVGRISLTDRREEVSFARIFHLKFMFLSSHKLILRAGGFGHSWVSASLWVFRTGNLYIRLSQRNIEHKERLPDIRCSASLSTRISYQGMNMMSHSDV